ncbi:MAG: 1,4-alpha-glucan branching protein GlgB [Cocleimonas sp.]|nr:1,4-alpha-glucan branching protein GlgB [Cocleimonas sp.]
MVTSNKNKVSNKTTSPIKTNTKTPIIDDSLLRLQQGKHHDPFAVLGLHQQDDTPLIRAFLPIAEQVEILGLGSMTRHPDTDLFEYPVAKTDKLEPHYTLRWQEKGSKKWHETVSPYSFLPQISALDLHLFGEGNHQRAYQFMGAHLCRVDGIAGCQFALWSPNVQRVSVIGDFNAWDGRRHPMGSRGASGVWELFIPNLNADEVYKYEILTQDNTLLTKTDPYASAMALRPDTTSRIVNHESFTWADDQWLAQRKTFDWQHQPISIYELHAGSWRRDEQGNFLNWREIAQQLIPYVKEMGYTHLELLPIAEHPLDQSWGYQVTGFFAPTARFGTPDDFRYFIDQCHQQDLGVILDWVPAHFPKDAFALARFNGDALYEHDDPRRGEHQDWGTLIFNYGRNEVRNFLITNAVYWIEEFHLDGLRVDAVASMLYLDYSREAGQWLPNEFGGRENLEAIQFLRQMNTTVHGLQTGVLTMAEESTAWPMVSRPVELGGLGFSIKWNMGWMNDNLSYIENDPIYRKYHHHQLTFSQLYSYSENFVLPLSHDEVVHGKQSLVNKMPGDDGQKMANLRLFYAWQYAHSGKKLLFMGCEIAQWNEWNDNAQLDWDLLNVDSHLGIKQLITDLNKLYTTEKALYHWDFSEQGFQWIDCHDADQSVLSLMRQSDQADDHIICILNFTPLIRENYRIGVPTAANYQEILNTDSHFYSGSNCGNQGNLNVEAIAWSGFKQSIGLTLPPLGALFLKPS